MLKRMIHSNRSHRLNLQQLCHKKPNEGLQVMANLRRLQYNDSTEGDGYDVPQEYGPSVMGGGHYDIPQMPKSDPVQDPQSQMPQLPGITAPAQQTQPDIHTAFQNATSGFG